MKALSIKKAAISIIVIVLISFASIFVYLLYIDEPPLEPISEETTKISLVQMLTKTYGQLKQDGYLEHITLVDDDINPLAPQAIFFEVNRIRHKGLHDQIMKKGTSWRNIPQYYYTLTIDGFTHYSKDIYAPTGYEEILFETWDSMFQETRRVQSTNENQETSDITLKIIERRNKGILGLRTFDEEVETLQVTYCYRTGRWSGDNYFGHPDGYGHYRGEIYDIWFNIGQTTYARDGIPYWIKVNILGLDPLLDYSDKDMDDDGIPIVWEWRWGYDPFIWDDHNTLDLDIDGLTNIQEYNMASYYADPFSPDIYIEVDGMQNNGLFRKDYQIYDESIQIITEQFSRNGINIYFDNGWPGTPPHAGGELLDHVAAIDQDSGMQNRFYKHHFPDERKGIYRYLIICDGGGHAYASMLNRIDTMVVGVNLQLMLFNRKAYTPQARRLSMASTIFHELGHTLGLSIWTFQGIDNYTIYGDGSSLIDSYRAKKAYASIWAGYESSMNYLYVGDAKIIGYSDGGNGPPYDQNDWSLLYLPYYKLEADAIEDPTLYFDEDFNELPGLEVMKRAQELPKDIDIPPLSSKGYTYDEYLTLTYLNQLSKMVFIKNADVDIRAYVETSNASDDHRNVRVYARPLLGPTHYSEWSLIAEGYIDTNGLSIDHALWK